MCMVGSVAAAAVFCCWFHTRKAGENIHHLVCLIKFMLLSAKDPHNFNAILLCTFYAVSTTWNRVDSLRRDFNFVPTLIEICAMPATRNISHKPIPSLSGVLVGNNKLKIEAPFSHHIFKSIYDMKTSSGIRWKVELCAFHSTYF